MTNRDYRDELIRHEQEKRLARQRAARRRKIQARRRKAFLVFILLLLASGGFGTYYYVEHPDKWKALVDSAEKESADKEQINADSDSVNQSVNSVTSSISEKLQENIVEATSTDALITEEPEVTSFDIKLTFLGDCNLASDLENHGAGTILAYEDTQPNTYFFDGVRSAFEDDDLTVANCESAISDQALTPRIKPGQVQSLSTAGQTRTMVDNDGDGVAETSVTTNVGADGQNVIKGYWFKAPSKAARIFADNSIEAVTIDNNHSFDYGDTGFEDTKTALDNAGVDWGYKDKAIYYEKDGFTLAVVCVSFYSEQEAYDHMQYLEAASANSDFQVVYFHGGTEGVHQPDGWKQSVCHAFVDNGADLVIGSHPHVLQKREFYNGVPIVYSLGNFCFGGNSFPENRTLIYQYTLHIQDEVVTGYDENMIPCYVYSAESNNYQPSIIEDESIKERVLDFMNGNADSPF